ncbi:uncharacterized protein LOC143632317 [Bidens hawaiensis]|uniref:uncharacterized protein LOC143632317 n=1 Tax=Bidens hawaiensis TaxID=980011 RepID=UPI00404953D1
MAVASLYCNLAMGVDLLHGLRSKKLWFPCKYFSINAFTLAVIAVVMKLPVDLSGNLAGDVDQSAKLGSLAFLCTMMANSLPCLATMGSAELLTNITALGVFVITLVVNVCIQISTGVIGKIPNNKTYKTLFDRGMISPFDELEENLDVLYTIAASIYVALLLLMLIIYVCSSLAILGSKQTIESKYQQQHKATSKSTDQKQLTIEKLQQHVSNYWVMAESSSPQFILASSATTAASGVICVLSFLFHALIIIVLVGPIQSEKPNNYDSDYKWSTLVILIVQFLGVILGTIAPFIRCFASLSFKLSSEIISKHIKVFKVEKYWTQKLYDWKYGRIKLPFRSHILKMIIKNLTNLVLDICIFLQKFVVVLCKIIALILFLLTQFLRCLTWPIQALFCSWGERTETFEQSKFVLQLENENKLAERILKDFSKPFDQLIKKSENKQPKNLIKLITERSTKDFQGVIKYDSNDKPDCWSLAVVTLTTIATTLPHIKKVEVESLLKSVREGLTYITFVEESLNANEDYESIQKAAKTLWEEVDLHNFHHKWLGFRLKDIASQGNTTPQIVQLFLEKAKSKIKEGDERTHISICADSMSRIAQTIIDDKESHDKLFDELSSRIADIMAACLTNLPQVIAMKAHTSVIEKREANVKVAARLLGETKEIIKTLQDPSRHVPSMNPDELLFIDNWRAHLSEP